MLLCFKWMQLKNLQFNGFRIVHLGAVWTVIYFIVRLVEMLRQYEIRFSSVPFSNFESVDLQIYFP